MSRRRHRIAEVLAKGPSVKAGLGRRRHAERQPSPASRRSRAYRRGPARSRIHDGKHEIFAFRATVRRSAARLEPCRARRSSAEEAADPEDDALGRSRRSSSSARCAAWSCCTATALCPARCSARSSGRTTRGHRFLGKGAIEIPQADDVRSTPRARGQGDRQLRAARAQDPCERWRGARRWVRPIAADDALYDEVTALVEFPAVYAAHFEQAFLEVPQECLMLTMQQNQKYFPLVDGRGKLLNRFLIVSQHGARAPAPHRARQRARAAGAPLRRASSSTTRIDGVTLESRVPKLGRRGLSQQARQPAASASSVFERLAGVIAAMLGCRRGRRRIAPRVSARPISLTGMVGEFPELQGHHGHVLRRGTTASRSRSPARSQRTTARASPATRCRAMRSAPASRSPTSSTRLPASSGIGPAAHRRQGSLRVAPAGAGRRPASWSRAASLALSISRECVQRGAFEGTPGCRAGVRRRPAHVHSRADARLSPRCGLYGERDRVGALHAPHAAGSRAATARRGARVRAPARGREPRRGEQARGEHPAAGRRQGRVLPATRGEAVKEPGRSARCSTRCTGASRDATPRFEQGDFAGYLQTFAVLKSPVDAFFDTVMVMVEDAALRSNRLALLDDLRREMNRVADISKLA